MPPKKKSQSLRQRSLFDHQQSLQKPSSMVQRRSSRRLVLRSQLLSDDESEHEGLGAIKLEPKKSIRKLADESDKDNLCPGRKPSVSDDNTSVIQRRQLIGKRQHSNTSEEEEKPSPRRRKLVKGKRRAVESSSDDLDVEVEKDRIISSRLRIRNKMTTFQKNLERLKRRKQKRPSKSSSSNPGDGTDTNEEQVFEGAKPTSDYDSLFDEGSDASHSSDFIVEDDDPVPTPLPTQFSMETHQDLDHQFKKVFQFFVHIAVRPAKERQEFMKEQLLKEEYFSIPLQVARRKLSGLRDSLVASSVWRPDFKRPLETYPEFDLIPLDFAVPACDACHLGGRLSTLIGRLSGLPYDRSGFETIDEFLASNDGSDDDHGSSDDSNFQPNKPSKTIEYNLGRFCARRTRVYHEFTHWEYNLFKCIRDEVDDLHASNQSGGFFRIAYAGGKRPPKDLDDADGICEWLDERKVIDMQWEKVKIMMESARHLELASKRGDDD